MKNSTWWGRNCLHVKNICGFFSDSPAGPRLPRSIMCSTIEARKLGPIVKANNKAIRSPWSTPFSSQWKQNCRLSGDRIFFWSVFFLLGVGYLRDLSGAPAVHLSKPRVQCAATSSQFILYGFCFCRSENKRLSSLGKGTVVHALHTWRPRAHIAL